MSTITEKNVKLGTKNIRFNVETYSSAQEVARDCETRAITNPSFQDMKKAYEWSWRGCKNYDEALSFLRNGYQPTVDKMKQGLKISKQGNGKRISFANNIVGFAPVVPLAMMGVPQSMVDMKMKPIKCKVLDVYYDITATCDVDSKQIIANGEKVLGAIMELERAGYRFNLYAMQGYAGSDNDDSVDMLVVKVKSASQPLDLKRISFPLTHTSFFRVIGFDWYSKTPKGTYRYGYGKPLSKKFKDKEQLDEISKQLFGENAIYLNGPSIAEHDQEYLQEVFANGKAR